MTSTPEPENTAAVAATVSDEQLRAAHDVALAALYEITDEATVGEAAGQSVEPDGSVSLLFTNRLPGYPGWMWTVTVTSVDGAAPTVLEAELLPGEGALVAPEWVPWAERLAEYRAHQAELAEQAANDDSAIDDDSDHDDDDDDDDDEIDLLHSGDLDGVDIDELDDSDDSEDDDDSDDDDSDDDDSDDDEEEDSDDSDDSDDEE
ncbi:DUF3027 domain-containing protein [Microbacterium sp. YY-01]|uniref:DUF3027 domain-containing protein n=1 Tax=Microbacterium sp. YY-01 TaxID=3421634 RepID=UPI003D1796DA